MKLLLLISLLLHMQVFAQEKTEAQLPAAELMQSLELLQKGAKLSNTDPAQARQLVVQALEICKRTSNHGLLHLCYASLSWLDGQSRSPHVLEYDSLALHHGRLSKNHTFLLDGLHRYAQDLMNHGYNAKAVELLKEGSLLAEQKEARDFIGRFNLDWGTYYYNTNDYTKAKEHYLKSNVVFARLKNMPMAYYALQKVAEAAIATGHTSDQELGYLFEASDYFKKSNRPKDEAECHALLGAAFNLLGNLQQAIPYYAKARELFLSVKYTAAASDQDNSLALAYMMMQKPDSAAFYLKEAETLAQASGYVKGMALAANLKVRLLALQKKYEQAQVAATDAREKNKKINRQELDVLYFENMGLLKAETREVDSSAYYMLRRLDAIKKSIPQQVVQRVLETELSKFNITDRAMVSAMKKLYSPGQPDLTDEEYLALMNSTKTLVPSIDSNLAATYQKQLTEMETKYHTQRVRDSVALSRLQLLNAEKTIQQRNLWLVIVALSVLAVSVAGIYQYRLRKARTAQLRQAERDAQVIERLNIELDHRGRNILSRIVGLISETAVQSSDQETFDVLQQRVEPLTILYSDLGPKGDEDVFLQDYLEKICNGLRSSYAVGKEIDVSVKAQENLDGDKAGLVGMIVNEVVTNSFKHAFAGRKKGFINVSLRTAADGRRHLHVHDNGPGIRAGEKTGSGLEIIEGLVTQLPGDLKQYNDNGAHFEIIFI
jgi:two-component sensor histidine kinase